MERLEAALSGLAGFKADFRQTVTDAQGQLIETADGQVALARPGRFRWDYRVPAQLIVSDGTTVWFHDVDLEQVTIRRAADTLVGTPALLLSGQADLRAEFEIADGGQEDNLTWSRLTPRSNDSDFRELRVGIAGGQLRRMTLIDRLGQTTRLEFDHVGATRASLQTTSRRRRASTSSAGSRRAIVTESRLRRLWIARSSSWS
jgi:outer membrane lipoprotein carrier protein